jgi:hypothetical protein
MTLLLRLWRPALATVSCALLLTACAYDNKEDLLSKDPAPDCGPMLSTYSADVAPLLQQKCNGCHNSQFLFGLQTYAQVRTVALDGSLVGSVSHAAGFQAMPQNGTKLSDCEITLIRRWVEGGALNN